jgi:glutathione S-transferase
MMKLYYSAGSCSTSCHITLEESGLQYEAIEVDFDNASDANIALTAKLNTLGTLPVLVLDNGKVLDQNLSIATYIADLAPQKKLLPEFGTFERAQAMNWLSFVAADLHKGVGGLFSVPYISQDKNVQGAAREFMLGKANEYLKYLDTNLAGKDYVTGSQFTVADSYAFVVCGWTKWLEIPLTPYKNVEAYMARVAARPAVHKVLQSEGLLG